MRKDPENQSFFVQDIFIVVLGLANFLKKKKYYNKKQ